MHNVGSVAVDPLRHGRLGSVHGVGCRNKPDSWIHRCLSGELQLQPVGLIEGECDRRGEAEESIEDAVDRHHILCLFPELRSPALRIVDAERQGIAVVEDSSPVGVAQDPLIGEEAWYLALCSGGCRAEEHENEKGGGSLMYALGLHDIICRMRFCSVVRSRVSCSGDEVAPGAGRGATARSAVSGRQRPDRCRG